MDNLKVLLYKLKQITCKHDDIDVAALSKLTHQPSCGWCKRCGMYMKANVEIDISWKATGVIREYRGSLLSPYNNKEQE